MRVVMLSTAGCQTCKRMRPVIEDHCEKNSIEFEAYDITEAPKEIVDIIYTKGVSRAPAFVIYREEDPFVVTGEDIFLELNAGRES